MFFFFFSFLVSHYVFTWPVYGGAMGFKNDRVTFFFGMAETCRIKGSSGIIQVRTSVCTAIMVDDTIHVKLVPYLTFFFQNCIFLFT